MTSSSGSFQRHYARLQSLLRLMRRLRIGEWQAVVVQALLMGLAGAAAALLFDEATRWVRYLFTGLRHGGIVACFAELPPLWRILLPALGALPAAALVLLAGRRTTKPPPEYMEAFSLGDGRLPLRQGLLRSCSAVLSLGSGAAIGKEGALIQIAAVAASAIDRWLYVSPARLRLMVGCGAAAGMTAAFHTPLAACLFVCEVVVGTFSIGTLAPLLLASCSAYALAEIAGGSGALFVCPAAFGAPAELAACIALGLLAAPAGKLWVFWLGFMRRISGRKRLPLALRMSLAGLLVGIIALYEPAVTGNGYEALLSLRDGALTPAHAASLLGLKAFLVALVFGAGTMGGVLTPTLMIGAFLGYLIGCGGEAVGLVQPGHALACAFVGMAAFFAVAGRTPVTALLLVIEFSLSAPLLFPLMLAVGAAYALGRLLPVPSLYDPEPRQRGASDSPFDQTLREMRVGHLCRPLPLRAGEQTALDRVMRLMLRHPGANVPVQDAQGHCVGVVRRAALLEPLPKDARVARDLVDRSVPVLCASQSLPEALEIFRRTDCRSLPVSDPASGRLMGSLSRYELYQTIALLMRRELARAQEHGR